MDVHHRRRDPEGDLRLEGWCELCGVLQECLETAVREKVGVDRESGPDRESDPFAYRWVRYQLAKNINLGKKKFCVRRVRNAAHISIMRRRCALDKRHGAEAATTKKSDIAEVHRL
jgi:hypothetical protein